MRTLGFILASGAVCLLLAGSAFATATGWITMSFYNVSPGENVNYVAPGKSGSTTAGVYNQKVYLNKGWGDLLDSDGNGIPDQEASELIASLGLKDGGSGTTAWAYASTFCADIKQYASGSFLRYDIFKPADAPIGGGNTPMGDAKAADLRRLFDNYSAYGIGALPYTLGTTTYGANQTSAAFQASVWEIIYETSAYDVKQNVFRITSSNASRDLANYWLTHLGDVDPCLGLRILVRDDQQDFAIVVPGVGRDPIPEPVTMAGVMLGIGSIAGYVRRRRTA
jgi:hypothetical protein